MGKTTGHLLWYFSLNHSISLLDEVKGRVCIQAKWPIRLSLISGFSCMRRVGVFLLSPGWDASPSQGYPQHQIPLHTFKLPGRGTVRIKCLVQEHNTLHVPGQDMDKEKLIKNGVLNFIVFFQG